MAKKTKWRCMVCASVYDPAVGDPDSGVKPGTPFSALPDDWICPLCGGGKEEIEESKEGGVCFREPVSLAPNVHWVGAKDPGLTVFDIVIPTEFGTTYNAYLVRGTDKTALIDCVKREFAEDLFRNLSRFLPVGGTTLRFLNPPFLHWPDTILTYLVEDKILFPCDFLGAHYCSPEFFNDELREPEKVRKAFEFYYGMIMRPYKEHVLKACEKIKGLPIAMIAPSHGPILRKDPRSYIAWYEERASVLSRVTEKKVTVVYASAYGNTAAMAARVAQGVRSAGGKGTPINSAEGHMNEIIDEIETSAGFLIGTPTLNSNVPHPILHLIANLVVLNGTGMPPSGLWFYA